MLGPKKNILWASRPPGLNSSYSFRHLGLAGETKPNVIYVPLLLPREDVKVTKKLESEGQKGGIDTSLGQLEGGGVPNGFQHPIKVKKHNMYTFFFLLLISQVSRTELQLLRKKKKSDRPVGGSSNTALSPSSGVKASSPSPVPVEGPPPKKEKKSRKKFSFHIVP